MIKCIRPLLLTLMQIALSITSTYSQAPIKVTLPDTTAISMSEITVPIYIDDLTGKNVTSYQFSVVFDASIIDAVGASSAGTLTESYGAPIVNVNEDGKIVVGAFGTSFLSGGGILVILRFNVVGNPGDQSKLEFESFIFNNGAPAVQLRNGRVTIDPVVPVELSHFSAHVGETDVYLHWTTATETNNYGFDIERRNDEGIFAKVGFVAGQGTISHAWEYEYVDRSLSPGRYVYRLKQIDTDGSFSYEGELSVLITIPARFELSQNYPNPFNPVTVIRYTIPGSGLSFVQLRIYNANGVLVRTLVDNTQTGGHYELIWDGKDDHGKEVSSGIYPIRLLAGRSSLLKIAIKIK